MDNDFQVPEHKTKADILTVPMAVKAGKSSKFHKMKPRSPKRDRTKTAEKKTWCKNRRFSHEIVWGGSDTI